MTKPIINLRCDGPILCEGTIFIRKENRGNGVEVNVLFERKGLGTALEMFKNIFRNKDKASIDANDWARNLADTVGGRPGYSTGYSIEVNSLIKNINDASHESKKSFDRTFNLSLINKGASEEKIEFFAFVEKKGFLPAEMRDEEEKISQLSFGKISATEELKTMTLEDLKRKLTVLESLHTPKVIAEDPNLRYAQNILKMRISDNQTSLKENN